MENPTIFATIATMAKSFCHNSENGKNDEKFRHFHHDENFYKLRMAMTHQNQENRGRICKSERS
jgi:hypothetical protein